MSDREKLKLIAYKYVTDTTERGIIDSLIGYISQYGLCHEVTEQLGTLPETLTSDEFFGKLNSAMYEWDL